MAFYGRQESNSQALPLLMLQVSYNAAIFACSQGWSESIWRYCNPNSQWHGHFFGGSCVVFCVHWLAWKNWSRRWKWMEHDGLGMHEPCKWETSARLLARSSAAPWRDESCWTRAGLEDVLLEMPRKYRRLQLKICQDSGYKYAQGKCEAGSQVLPSSRRNPAHYRAKSKLQHEQWHPKEWMVFSLMQVPKVELKHLHSNHLETPRYSYFPVRPISAWQHDSLLSKMKFIRIILESLKLSQNQHVLCNECVCI